ncbi:MULTISPECIES: nitrile hydratase accessory protein [unclassified Aeromicrobium]|uniref:nitrile hydratase accessory protein n=1 Tax=unclassified Aeromicrobium TaxID=2633570 RepID=UPI00288ACC9B|nr:MULTISPECIES: nitrile hydratase accessory protein [unclassified Aeromicrobium]
MTDRTVRPDSAEPQDEIVDLVERLPLGADDMAFDEPWQLRAFALAVAAHKSGQYPWARFQTALIASIGEWENSEASQRRSWSYFEHWVNAVESVLAHGDRIDRSALEERVRDVLDTPAARNHHEPHFEPVAVAPPIARTDSSPLHS